MAQRVEILLIDDLTGETADETINFTIDGLTFELDLSTANAEALRAALDPYMAVARRTGGSKPTRRSSVTRNTTLAPDPKAVRAWAASQPDITLSPRGRVPQRIVDQFQAAHL